MPRIAIIGIGCRFPGGADDAASYWSLLAEGRCALREIPAGRWSLAGFHDERADLPDRSYSRWGGFLDDIRGFDAAWFGLSPREAEAMDPQQRLLLEVACDAVADARLPIAALRRRPTGVFIGVSNVDYGLLQRYRPGHGDIQAGTGTALSIVANRVSNRLDLSGPSMGVDTACSSSLVAVDTACRHLADGSCDMALAGGANILLDPRMFITFSRAHMLSPTGRIRAFDAAADGFVRGEGVGVVLLRRLDDAIAAGDPIYAIVEATAVNQDGRTGTITEPSPVAQRAMLEAVVARAGAEPAEVGYVEAHGTGTPVGDPIEAKAIGAVLGGRARRGPLPIGSAKTNIGHLEPAAGIAGLIKAALVLHHRQVPPSLGFEQPNPAIRLDELGLTVPCSMQALPGGGRPPLALVNSFGFGGTNACALLSAVDSVASGRATIALVIPDKRGLFRPSADPGPGETGARSAPYRVLRTSLAPGPGSRTRQKCHSLGRDGGEVGEDGGDPACGAAPIPVPLSAPTQRHLQALAGAVAASIADGVLRSRSVQEIAAALSFQRDHHEHRAVVIAATPAELAERLRCLSEGREWPQAERHAAPAIIRGIAKPGRKLCFTMTGQGGQWWAMGRELIEREPLFRAAIGRFDSVFSAVGGWSVMEALLADEAASRIDDAAITPAVMFAFQTALAEMWRARGVAPDIVLGHSFGEVTAAHLAGGIDASEVARLVDQRGLIRHRVDRVGTMAAIGLGAEEIAQLLPAGGSIEIGGYNAPAMVTLTGEEAAIDRLIARLNAEDPTILTRKLALDFAYHSSWFEPVENVFKSAVGSLHTSPPRLPVVSTVTGRLNDHFDTDYWWQNLRHPVRYQQAVETALDLGADVFVELGPHRTLSSMTAACAAAKGREVVTVTTLDRRWGDLVSLAVATGQLWAAGVPIDWAALMGDTGRAIELPHQPWLRQPLWLEPDEAAQQLRPVEVHPLLGRMGAGPTPGWLGEISLASHAWLSDHRLDGNCVFPAAAYLEMLAVAARDALGADVIELNDVTFPAALFIGSDDEVQLATHYEPGRRRLAIHSRVRGGGPDWTLRAAATAFVARLDTAERQCSTSVLALPGAAGIDVAQFYAAAQRAGYGWGAQFQGLKEITRTPGAARGAIAVAAGHGFHLDPRLLDSALQLMLASGDADDLLGVMPTGIARIVVTGSPGHSALALGRTASAADGGITADIEIAAADGPTVVRISGLTARRRSRQVGSTCADARLPRLLVEASESVTVERGKPLPSGRWALLAGEACGFAERLADAISHRGAGCETIAADAGAAPRIERLLQAEDVAAPLQIVDARALAAVDCAPLDVATTAHSLAHDIIAFGRLLAAHADQSSRIRVIVLTRNARLARPADPIDEAGLVQVPVLAAARTMAMELPDIALRLVDCDDAGLADPERLLDVLSSTSAESELALRGVDALAFRIVGIGCAGAAPARMVAHDPSREAGFALEHAGAPGPESLRWRSSRRAELKADEVEVEVAAVGLNFRDLMAVSGLLPAEAEPEPAIAALGLEMAGVVRRLGGNVHDLKPGDRVLGMGRGLLSRFAAMPRQALHQIPAGLSDAEAATIPSAYLTAHYALSEQARLAAGETVLVHSATGGVGLAAIALARRAGARIIATAGTEARREHLRKLGIADAFDSRSAAFADGVMRATGGRGVDVVLNSLSGALLEKGLGCLAPHGRFVELGKRDVYDNAALGLKALRSNISFHVVDVAALIVDRPQLAARLLGEVMSMLAAGEIAPLPHRCFAADAVADAFRHFASGAHIGKIVVSLADPRVDLRRAYADGDSFDSKGTYLVTGGTRGFGRAVGEWLAARGAGRVVLASRSGELERVPLHESRVGWVSQAIDPAHVNDAVESVPLDVTSASDVDRLVARLARSDKPLRGIFHAAVTYDDALLEDMTPERIERVLAPKIDGAWNLTRAVENCGARLDQLVMFSSLAQVVGWPGQSNYAAANAFLEALAHLQHSRGIPGQCINWGALGESGHVARSDRMQGYLDSSGWIAIDNRSALDAMARALDIDLPVVTIAAADWPRLAATHRPLGRSARLAGLGSARSSSQAAGRGLLGLDGTTLEAAALTLVAAQTARVLRAPVEAIEPGRTLAEAGIDSLSSFELHNRIEQEAGIAVPMPRYAKARRISELATLLVALVEEARARSKA